MNRRDFNQLAWSQLALSQAALGGVAALTVDSAFAIDYLSPEKARIVLIPSAASFVDITVQLNAEQMAAVGRLGRITPRSSQWRLSQAINDQGQVIGAFVVDNVIGKYELITYAVAVSTNGAVSGVEVLSYRESHGGEIRLPAWRKQFVGKTTRDPIEVGNDIALISGATLSSVHVTDGIRRINAVLEVARDVWTKKQA